jgi:hypothetical protein
MLLFLCAVFVLSGAAGLIYESIWVRYLGLFVGHGAYAQVLVLVIFLGGMSAGALLAGRRTAALREPLRWYAYVELAVGLLGLVFLLAGRILPPGESVCHPTGWRFESVAADTRRIIRVRLHAPEEPAQD